MAFSLTRKVASASGSQITLGAADSQEQIKQSSRSASSTTGVILLSSNHWKRQYTNLCLLSLLLQAFPAYWPEEEAKTHSSNCTKQVIVLALSITHYIKVRVCWIYISSNGYPFHSRFSFPYHSLYILCHREELPRLLLPILGEKLNIGNTK